MKLPIKISKKKLFLVIICLILFVAVLWCFKRQASAPLAPTDNQTTQADQKANKPQKKKPETNPTRSAPKAPAKDSSITVSNPNDILVVVNKKRALPNNFYPNDLVSVGSGQTIRSVGATSLSKLLSAAKKAGVGMYVISGFRSQGSQASIYNSYVTRDGQVAADRYSARPGHSEHQTGLAADLGNGNCNLDGCFANTPAGKWLASNAHKYGFIIRYPSGKESITGYIYEPWHVRYVGVDVATKIKNSGQTLEQYMGLPSAPSY